MDFSLELLAERLQWPRKDWQVSKGEAIFQELGIYEAGQPLHAGTVYLTTQSHHMAPMERVGFLMVLPPTAEFPAMNNHCLCYRTNQSAIAVFNQATCLLSQLREMLTHFQQCAYREKNFQALMGLAYKIFNNPGYLVDSSFRVIAIDRTRGARHLSATWRHMEDDGYVPFVWSVP